VVGYLDMAWPRRTVRPLKTDPILHVDADAVLALSIANECFKPIAGQSSKVIERCCSVQNRQPFSGLFCKALERPDKFAKRKAFRITAAITDNYLFSI